MDIVERLRTSKLGPTVTMLEAADEIERLRAIADTDTPELLEQQAEIERLRAALKPFAMCAAGMILNPEPQDWRRAKEVLGMVPAESHGQEE